MDAAYTDDRPWFGRDRDGNILARAPWMRSYAAEGKVAFLNLTSWWAVRKSTDDLDTIEEITDPAEYEAARAVYSAWNETRLKHARLEQEEEARRANEAASEDAQRRQAEERANLLMKEKEEAVRRYRITDLQPEHCSFHTFYPSNGGERALLFVATAHDPAATVQSFFDVGMDEIVPLGEGSLGPSITHGKRFTNAIECFRGWQVREREIEAERLRQERTNQARTRLLELASALTVTPFSIVAPEDALEVDSVDLRLAIEWSEEPHRAKLKRAWELSSDVRTFEAALRDHDSQAELSRTLSARIAEKAVKWFYETNFRTAKVEDISRKQGEDLLKPTLAYSKDWTTHDLVVRSGSKIIPLDVKNARANFVPKPEYERRRQVGSAEPTVHYTEHCVPRFKKSRQHRDVVIAGVLSKYRTPLQLLTKHYDSKSTPKFLGETEITSVERLGTQFNSKILEVDLRASSRFGRGTLFIPPWMFDYPESAYRSRREILDDVHAKVAEFPDLLNEPSANLWPLYLASGVLNPALRAVNILEEPWRQFVQQLTTYRISEKLSLPVLYLTILQHFLFTLAGGQPGHLAGSESPLVRFDPAKYRSFLYIGNALEHPLGIYDPLKTVDSLITSLCALARHNPRELLRFRLFKFKQTGVLTARRNRDDQETTIMFPYCGGEKCGREGLVLGAGRTRNCQQCGHLICPNPWCRFCSRRAGCYKRQNRRKEWAARKQPHVEQHTPATPPGAPLLEQPFADDDLPF